MKPYNYWTWKKGYFWSTGQHISTFSMKKARDVYAKGSMQKLSITSPIICTSKSISYKQILALQKKQGWLGF